ncbi:MAG TPA: ATP-binding protein, partial [Bacteroidales bacterium]|nr:ATP-binding protein [Bacteroidales bacterium]
EIENKHFLRSGLFTAGKIPEYLKLFAKLLVKKESSTIDFDWKHKTLGNRSGTAHIGPMMKHGKVTGLQAYIKDTTQQKEFEKTLIEAKEKAEENDRLKSTFLATMSHELRTPLNAVIGFSELIDRGMDIDSILEMTQIINENGQRLLKIIESIFEISSLEAKKPELKKEVFSLDDMFSILGNSLKSYIGRDKRDRYSLVYMPDNETEVKYIKTDRYKLEQLLSNLLTNAAKYTPEGEINYGYSTTGRDITFFVKDSGIGIPEDKQAIIFEKFRQIDDSYTRKQDGIGLGLAICKEIAKILGGELWLESEKGKGSVFYFTLPGAVAERPESNKNDKSYALPGMNGNSVLIVEDEESNYLYLKTLISKTGAHISWAKNGEESIEMVSKNPGFSLVLMDIRMPGMDGYEATRIIKEMHPTMRVIAQTAYAMKADREEAYKNGFDGYISKPIDKRSLYSLLDEPEKPVI